ncbi:DUF418 domain protein [Natronomonas pharaonis DSM 2160]|uniref:DUF418 domain protein n=1 Tax=Natronomonas pharaonis (strain ATCC 35678 / DSM 2160 / CIP 103997 / JCM 8858 / NBRC 14720 / NCIMB 2260 / Gabara) TaxID=348780 RepID=A0A1U7EXD4_NATPD|nr:DUF418 domain-containing protein [Natronomonas pharaonis]CAI49817.1 DUF418 domain protein [Natronomonas pharaonis DSM 2160]
MPSDGRDCANDGSPTENSGESGPTAPEDRIVSLDVLRGVAILGILVINIWLFGLPMAAGMNPTLYGDFSGLNYLAWLVSHVFFEQKFVTLFTFLFGAGIVLFVESKEAAGRPARRLYFRRTGWLLVAGLLHAYLLWHGDILVAYALCGMLVVFVRNWRPRRLLLLGVAMFALPSLLYLVGGAGYMVADATTQDEINAAVTAGVGGDAIAAEIDAYRGSWTEQIQHRAPTVLMLQTFGFAVETFWMLGGLMSIGMALYKYGIISNRRASRFYRRLLVAGGTAGLALILTGVWYREAVGWETAPVVLLAHQFNYWGALLLSLSYVAAVMLFCRAAAESRAAGALAAVGRTAFSNYILQTVLATTLFYGHGVGWFGTLSRIELLGVVVAIWAIQVPLSVAWLRRYRFGPIEWLWRTLTYRQWQPLRVGEKEK